MKYFNEIFIDKTKYGVKIQTGEYGKQGKHIIVDQGQNQIAGYTDREDGLFEEVPVIIFGDHTRVIKYIDQPFFLGADGVKVLRSKDGNTDYKYLYYALKNVKIPNTGYNRHFKWLKESKIEYPDIKEQRKIVRILDKVSDIIQNRKRELSQLDDLVRARFVEMFGDPITNSKLLPIEKIEERYFLKAGITTKAEDIHDYLKDKYEIPCYGGNGIRGYVENLSYEGCYPIIGRQGALCGNVQYATGKFHATEHAVLVSTLKNDNTMWVYYMLKLMDLYRYHTGAAQPGLAVKKLNTIDVIVADINLQNQFAAFVHQINKSKFVIHKFLYCTTHNTKSIIKPRPNTKESGKIRGRETTCRRILTF